MAKPIKILIVLVGMLLLLIVAAAIALPLLFDPNDYRAQIADAVKKQTGREFAVGEIHLAVFPWLRVELRDVTFGNATGFGTVPMLTVQRAEVGARLVPLLRDRRIEASAITLSRAEINLAVNREGLNNWQDLMKPVDPAAPVEQVSIAQHLQKLDIAAVQVDQLKLAYDDQQTGLQWQLSEVQLKTGRLHQGKPFAVTGHFKATATATAATADFTAEVTLAENGDVTLAGPTIKLDAAESGATARALGLALQGESLHYTAATHTVSTSPLTLELDHLSDGPAEKPALKAKGQLVTTLSFNLASGDATLDKTELKLDAGQSGPQPLAMVFELQAERLSFAKAAQTFTTTPLTLQIESLVIGAADKPMLMAKGRVGTQLASDLAQQTHALKGLNAELQLAGSAMPGGKVQTLQLDTDLQANLALQQVTLSGLKLDGFGLKLSGRQWQVGKLGGVTPSLQGDLDVARFEPRALLTALGIAIPATADANTLKSASFSAQLGANRQSASLKNLVLKLDDTTLRGDISVRDFASHALGFALIADRLDVDRYLPPAPKPGASVGAAATPAAKAGANATELPVDLVDQLNAQGTLEVASMKLKNLKLANVRLKLDGAAGGTHRQQLAANLYGGSADLAVTVAPGAKHAVKLSLASINAGPLLKDFIDSDTLSGKGSMTLDVTSAGRTFGAVKQALDGKLAFNLVDGAVKGFNLGKIIRDGQAMLTQQAPAASAVQTTDFAELRGSGVFVKGVLKSDELTAKNPLLRLEGAGEIDLVKETINYLARPTLVNTASGQGGKERVDLTGIVVPIRLSGDLYKPKVSIDWQAALKQQAVTQLRDKLGVSEATVREQREALRSRAKEEIGKGLLKLFGNQQPKPVEPPPPAEPAPAP